jgi:hypothetical protein
MFWPEVGELQSFYLNIIIVLFIASIKKKSMEGEGWEQARMVFKNNIPQSMSLCC